MALTAGTEVLDFALTNLAKQDRDLAVADARQHGVTIQRLGGSLYDDFSAWSERQWLQWSGERVSKHCSEDAANACKRARGEPARAAGT